MSAMTSEREAFEKWLTEGDTNPESPPRDKHDRYVEQDVRYMWSAWQASAHLDQPAQAVDVGVVGFITHSADKLSRMEMTEAGMMLGVGKHALFTHAESARVPDSDRIDWMEANARSVSFGKAPQQGYWVHVQGVGYSHNESLRGAIDSAREAQAALAARTSQPTDAQDREVRS